MRLYLNGLLAVILTASVSACTAASDHGHDHDHADASHHGSDAHSDEEGHFQSTNPDKYGHLSAIYICGDEELQTSHTDKETKIAYKGDKFDVSRKVSIIDGAFGGETFEGKYAGQNLVFKGKGYNASLTLGDEVISCEKLTCIPLGGPH